jgi:hypothetical protein
MALRNFEVSVYFMGTFSCFLNGDFSMSCDESHHAERLVNLKVLAKILVSDFGYPRAM